MYKYCVRARKTQYLQIIVTTSQLFGSPGVVLSVFTEGNIKTLVVCYRIEDFLKGKLHLFYLFKSKPWNLVTCLLTIYSENWHLGIVTTAMFYIPKIIQVGRVKDDCCHSGGPIY